MRIYICLAILLIVTPIDRVFAQQQGVDPIGLNAVELLVIRKVHRVQEVSEWFRELSEPTQRVLADASTSLVILWPDGRLYYRSGFPLAGNQFRVASEVARGEDYGLLVQSLSDPSLEAILNANRSASMRRDAPNTIFSAYHTIREVSDPIRREAYMTLLGELQSGLDPEILRELRSMDVMAVAEPLSALSRINAQKLDNIREGRFEVVQLSGVEDWDAAIRHGIRELERDPTSPELSVELGPELKGFLRIQNGTSLREEYFEELMSRGQIELFIGPVASPEMMQVQPSDVQDILQRIQPSLLQ